MWYCYTLRMLSSMCALLASAWPSWMISILYPRSSNLLNLQWHGYSYKGGYTPLLPWQEEIDLHWLSISNGASSQALSDLANSSSFSSIESSSISLSLLTSDPRTTTRCAVTHAVNLTSLYKWSYRLTPRGRDALGRMWTQYSRSSWIHFNEKGQIKFMGPLTWWNRSEQRSLWPSQGRSIQGTACNRRFIA